MAHASSDTCPAPISQAADRSKIQGILGEPRVDGGPGNIVCGEGGARGEPLPGQTKNGRVKNKEDKDVKSKWKYTR